MQKFVIVFVLLLSSCSLYKIDVQQGNVITQEMLDQLELGMSARKVRFIMGTPLLQDSFHQNRWDYVFSFQEGRSGQRQQQVISLFFDEQSQLTAVSGDVAAGEAKPDISEPETEPQDTQPIL